MTYVSCSLYQSTVVCNETWPSIIIANVSIACIMIASLTYYVPLNVIIDCYSYAYVA